MNNLKEILKEVNGSTFITLNTCTIPALTGGQNNPMFKKVKKHTIGLNVMIFTNSKSNAYDNMVKRRLEKEGKDPDNFKLSPRVWGTRIPNTPFVEHNGKHYLEVICLHAGDSYYEFDGDVIPKSAVIGLKDKDEGDQGGLSNKVIVRCYAIDSITQITVNKNTYSNLVYV